MDDILHDAQLKQAAIKAFENSSKQWYARTNIRDPEISLRFGIIYEVSAKMDGVDGESGISGSGVPTSQCTSRVEQPITASVEQPTTNSVEQPTTNSVE